MGKKSIEKKTKKFEELLELWSDEECLYNFTKFLDRVQIGSGFVQDENGFFTHEIVEMKCGESILQSDPLELDWPLELVKFPEELKKDLH